MDNDMGMRNKLFVFGTYEAVAEACMKVWRSDGVSDLSSDGVRELDSRATPGLYVFEADCGNIAGSSASYCEALSKHCPSTLVGASVVAWGVRDEGPEHCFWGVSGYIDGTEVVSGITGSLPSSLPADIAALVDDAKGAGALPRSSIPQLHEYGAERLRQAAIDRLKSSAEAAASAVGHDGFPRWSLLTHSVNSLGLGGFEQGLSTLLSDSKLSACMVLSHQAASDIGRGTASWVDTLFCGSRTPSCDEDDGSRIPYSSKDVSIWSDRRVGVLQYIGNAKDDDWVADALAQALSSPNVTFQDGTHPLPWLVAHVTPDADAHAGLKRILASVGTYTGQFDGNVVGQAFRTAAMTGYSPDSLQMLLRMGQSPGFIVSKNLPLSSRPQAEQVEVAGKLMDGFRIIYGRLKDFPVELQRAFEDGTDCVAQAFEAKRTEELMSSAITDWTAASRAPATAHVTVVTKRSRRRTV